MINAEQTMHIIDGVKITDETLQRAEWRARAIASILSSDVDLDTKAEMLEAALDQARSEGTLDCAEICERVAAQTKNEDARRTASVMAQSFRELDRRNRASKISVVK